MCPDRRRKSQLRTILESLDILSGVLVSPLRTFEEIRHKKPLALALSTAISVAVISGLVLAPNPPELTEVIFDLPKGTLSLWAMLPIWALLFMTVVAAQVTFVHLVAILLRSKGTYAGIFCGICFAYLPGIFAAPLAMIRALGSSAGANAFYQAAFFLLCLWVFFLGVLAIQRNYAMTPLRAIIVGLFALIALVVMPAVLAVVAMTQVMT